jgi:Zn-dependent M28 family amino/carboxypeptidase
MRLDALLLTFVTAALPSSCSSGTAGTASAETVEFDQERAWKHLEAMVAFGPRPAGSQGAEKTRAYLEAELARYGLTTERETFNADTPLGPVTMANVVTTVPASTPGPDAENGPIVVLCSHYETKLFEFEFVGANDGGSSTAVLLELARHLARRKSPVTYRIVFLDGEEAMRKSWVDPDNRYGSRHHVDLLVRSGLIERVKACVLLDLVGDKDLRLTDDIYSDPQLKRAFDSAARANGLGAHVGGAQQRVNDDHLSFMAAGVPSVDLIDLDYGPNNDWWHSAEDTLDKCSADSLGAIGRITLLGLPAVEELVK